MEFKYVVVWLSDGNHEKAIAIQVEYDKIATSALLRYQNQFYVYTPNRLTKPGHFWFELEQVVELD